MLTISPISLQNTTYNKSPQKCPTKNPVSFGFSGGRLKRVVLENGAEEFKSTVDIIMRNFKKLLYSRNPQEVIAASDLVTLCHNQEYKIIKEGDERLNQNLERLSSKLVKIGEDICYLLTEESTGILEKAGFIERLKNSEIKITNSQVINTIQSASLGNRFGLKFCNPQTGQIFLD